MGVLVEIAWSVIRPVVVRLLESGASQEAIWRAVGQKIEELNYVGDASAIRALLDKVGQLIAAHAAVIPFHHFF